MIDRGFADRFTADWIDAWDNQDVARVLAHDTDEFEMWSPVIIKITGEPSGMLGGKERVAAYWTKAL